MQFSLALWERFPAKLYEKIPGKGREFMSQTYFGTTHTLYPRYSSFLWMPKRSK